MSEKENIAAIVRERVALVLGPDIAGERLVDDHTPLKTAQADSLDMIEIAMELEDAFAIEIEADEIPTGHTIASLTELTQSKIAGKVVKLA